jgi:hypothetical protein
MKIFTKFLDPKKFKTEHLKHIDCSIFIDDVPKSQDDLSEINIMVLAEPNEYFGLHDWTIQNKDLFNAILTWDDRILNTCPNSTYLAFGHSWFKPEQYETPKEKKFEIAHLSGILNKCYGHSMRHEIIARQNEFEIPTNFHKTIGDRNNLDDARKGKEIVFGNSQFGIAIENFSHRGFFTEKLLDCFLMRTIPIYWGCSNIGDYFNIDGIIPFKDTDELIYLTNQYYFNENIYNLKKDIIEENYQKALQYIDYEQNIINKVEEIFKLNKLI